MLLFSDQRFRDFRENDAFKTEFTTRREMFGKKDTGREQKVKNDCATEQAFIRALSFRCVC